jgi:hypothetical protein
MTSSEKPATKILVTVVGGIALAAILYVCRHWLPPIFRWLADILASAWTWIASSHALPGWIIVPLFIAALWCTILIVASFRRPAAPREPHWRDFAEFEFLGVLWRWHYGSRGDILDLVSFCPQGGCDMQTYGQLGQYNGMGQETTVYRCDRCGHTPEVRGGRELIENKVIREIQRLLRLDAWKNHVRPAS